MQIGNLLAAVESAAFTIDAYCVLPNHYHLLVEGGDVAELRSVLGKLHGRTSREWNLQDGKTGRKVWYRVFDRMIRSTRQYYSVLNYIHENPVKHGHCTDTSQWRLSSAKAFFDKVGRQQVSRLLIEYPPDDSGIKETGRKTESGLQARLCRYRP